MLSGFHGYLSLHGPFIDVFLHSSEEPVKRFAQTLVRRTTEMGLELGVKRFVFHIGMNPLVPVPEYSKIVCDQQAEFWAKHLDHFSEAVVCLENSWEPNPELQIDIIKQCGSDRLLTCIDVAHVFTYSKIPLKTWVKTLGSKMVHVHLNDTNPNQDEHLPIGRGVIPWTNAVSELNRGPAGKRFVLENYQLDHQQESLKFLKQHGFLTG